MRFFVSRMSPFLFFKIRSPTTGSANVRPWISQPSGRSTSKQQASTRRFRRTDPGPSHERNSPEAPTIFREGARDARVRRLRWAMSTSVEYTSKYSTPAV